MNPYTFSLALGATGLVVMALGGLGHHTGHAGHTPHALGLLARSAAMAIMAPHSRIRLMDTHTRVAPDSMGHPRGSSGRVSLPGSCSVFSLVWELPACCSTAGCSSPWWRQERSPAGCSLHARW